MIIHDNIKETMLNAINVTGANGITKIAVFGYLNASSSYEYLDDVKTITWNTADNGAIEATEDIVFNIPSGCQVEQVHIFYDDGTGVTAPQTYTKAIEYALPEALVYNNQGYYTVTNIKITLS